MSQDENRCRVRISVISVKSYMCLSGRSLAVDVCEGAACM